MSDITPDREAFGRLAARDSDEPVVMLNLLKFAAGDGTKEYGQYGSAVTKMVEERGGRIVWAGRPFEVLIGDEADAWDAVVLVEYPSAKAFIEMVTSPSYSKAHEHRAAGLERTKLIAMEPRV
jgi:uncharacterized protein (DUF1330 family)